jgi:hypothetical protein
MASHAGSSAAALSPPSLPRTKDTSTTGSGSAARGVVPSPHPAGSLALTTLPQDPGPTEQYHLLAAVFTFIDIFMVGPRYGRLLRGGRSATSHHTRTWRQHLWWLPAYLHRESLRCQAPQPAAAVALAAAVASQYFKNRRYIGKSQSKRPPKRTQRPPHRSHARSLGWRPTA